MRVVWAAAFFAALTISSLGGPIVALSEPPTGICIIASSRDRGAW